MGRKRVDYDDDNVKLGTDDSETRMLAGAGADAAVEGAGNMATNVINSATNMARRFIPRNKASGWMAYISMVMMSTMFFTLIYVGTRVVLNQSQSKVLALLTGSDAVLATSFSSLVTWVVSAIAFAFGTMAYLHFDSAMPRGMSWGGELGVWFIRIALQLVGYLVGISLLAIIFDANLVNASIPRVAEHLSAKRAFFWEFIGLLVVAAISGQLTHHTSEMVDESTDKIKYMARDRHSDDEKFAIVLPWAYAAGVILTYPLTHGCLGAIFAVGARLGTSAITGHSTFEPNMWIYVVANLCVLAFVLLVRGTMLVPMKVRHHRANDDDSSSSLSSSA